MNSRPTWRRAARMLPLAVALALGLAACGGGGGGSGTTGSTAGTTPTPTAAAAGTYSSGAITAFGSVWVNGHEFNTDHARVIDDDTGATMPGVGGLEVGEVVDVRAAAGSTAAAPVADELHVHPLARGYIDAADATAGTIKVMGQTVQLTSGTSISDHRACVSAATSPCAAITTAAGLVPSTVSGTTTTTTTAGNYVTVHGYLFGASSTAAVNIIATLVAVGDAPSPTNTYPAAFKAEGTATVGTSTLTIGALNVDLSKATCFAGEGKTPCASAFTTGEVVSAGAATSPALPATTLVADFARTANRMPVETAGSSVEVEGAVASVGTATFVVRGITVDASGLPSGTALPAVGDIVQVEGTVAANGQSVTATSLEIVHSASSVSVGLQGDATNVAPGTSTGTFTVSVLGQTITVTAQTRLADMSMGDWDQRNPVANPFNITTFQNYLAASTSKHVIVRAETDSTGALVAHSLAIVPASSVVAVSGLVDAKPAPVNSTTSGTPTTFSVHGVAVSADPAAISGMGMHEMMRSSVTVAAGDQVVVIGTLNGGVVTVGAKPSFSNGVLDIGAPGAGHEDRGEF
jgi:hypothetical protein